MVIIVNGIPNCYLQFLVALEDQIELLQAFIMHPLATSPDIVFYEFQKTSKLWACSLSLFQNST